MKALDAISRVLRGESVPGFPMKLPPPVASLVGFEAVSVEAGRTVFRLQTTLEKHANPMGTVHGGILCDLADAAMGMACASTLDAGESFTTLELKTNFLRPVREATLEARATVIHRGKSLVYVECDVVQVPEGKLVARASSTCTVLRGAEAAGR
jgi:uncharacterized protein (TIGR00369 family)